MTIYTDIYAGTPDIGADDGNAYTDDGKTLIPAGFTTTDKARLIRVPGGVRLSSIVVRNEDLDSGTTIAANIGYEAADPGSTLAAAPTAFASASTILRGAAVTEFFLTDPITFQEPVWITLIPTAGPTTTAGYVRTHAFGELLGIK